MPRRLPVLPLICIIVLFIALIGTRTSQPQTPMGATVVGLLPTATATPTPTLTLSPTYTSPAPSPTARPTLPGIAMVAQAPTAQGQTHIVARGESLFMIAQQYNVSFETLLQANQPIDPNTIYVGQAIVIPPDLGTPAQATQTPAPATTRIAQMFSVHSLPVTSGSTPRSVNGTAIDTFILISPEVELNMREIYHKGQELGRNPRAFSKLGDSTIENPHFLTRFDEGDYNLGSYAYLQPVIDYYKGSFGRSSAAVRRGLHTWSVLDPMWASNPSCLPAEHMLTCEFRVHNPSLLFIRLGSNDAGIPESVDKNLRRIVEYSIENGVIPIMGTKADRFEGGSNINNQIIRRIAVDYQLPLWDFDLIAGTIPGRGLTSDNVHMTSYYAHDWTQPAAFTTGHGVHSLTALMVLEKVMFTLNSPLVELTGTPP